MKIKNLNLFTRLIFIVLVTVSLVSCDEDIKNDDTENKINNESDIELKQKSLIDIPLKIVEETDRNEIDPDFIGIDVFESNSAQNEQVNILKKMFPDAAITTSEASEVFDSHNIVYEKKEYCAIVVYEQNDNEEFVIHTIFIAKGLFSGDLLVKIFS